MTQTIQAQKVTLLDLEEKFRIQLVEDEKFFREWQDDLPKISEEEKRQLNRVKVSYSNLIKYPPLLENNVKMVVLSPLLDLAGFYLPPFHIKSEQSIKISAKDEGVIIRGQIDILAIHHQFWVIVIESKKAGFSLEVGIPQILAYMLSESKREKPVYGLITNGTSFRFLKLVTDNISKYSVSKIFDMFNPGNDLYDVLRILKNLAQLSSCV